MRLPAVQEMERLMRLHDDVMRVLTIKVDKHVRGPCRSRCKSVTTVSAATAMVVGFGGGERRERPSFGDRPERSGRSSRSFPRSASLI